MKFRVLDSWRGICAILVALFHLSFSSHFSPLTIIQNGGRGVAFFFVLSGFVIAHAYGERLRDAEDAKRFVIRRFGRLYPLHIATLLFVVVLELGKLALVTGLHIQSGDPPFGGGNSVPALIENILLLNGLGISAGFTWNGPSWSISAEFYTYLLFLMVAVLARKWQLGLSIVIAMSAAVALVINLHTLRLGTTTGAGFLECIYGFFLGTLSYPLFRYIVERGAPPRWLEWLALATIIAAFSFDAEFFQLFLPPIFAGAIIVFAFEKGDVSRFLLNKHIHHLGVVSYSIYLVHFPIISIINGVARAVQSKFHLQIMKSVNGKAMIDIHAPFLLDVGTILFLVLVIVISGYTYRYIEDPARRYFNGLAGRRPNALAEPAVRDA